MRLSFALFLLSVIDVAQAFVVVQPTASSCTIGSIKQSTGLMMSESETKEKEADDYDDWYADFDPSTADAINTKHSNEGQSSPSRPSSSGNRSGGNRNQQATEHDYTRDENADSSTVDLNQVNALMNERLQCRKTGQFDEADAIRDDLLATHGVMVRDKERTWRSGCTKRSNEGNRWMRDNKAGRDNNTRGRNQPKDFGPNGHDYSLSKNAGPNISELSLEKINSLLKERMEYKFSRDFRAADAIQKVFFEAGVLVNDREKEWRADGKHFEGHGTRSYDFRGNAADVPGNKDELQAMVDERARFKAERLYKEADKLRDELADKYDIFIDDRQRQWNVGGNQNLNSSNRREQFGPFAISELSERPEDHDEIQRMVAGRDAARADRNYDAADSIRNKLLDRNIFIDDKRRQWAVGDAVFEDDRAPRRARNDSFSISGLSERPEDHDEIQQMVERRVAARGARDFDTADGIRNQLLDRNIYIDDKRGQWAVGDACFGEDSRAGNRSGESADYFRRGGGSISKEDEETVVSMLRAREAHKRNRRYQSADDIRDKLRDDFKVRCDDRAKEWHVVTDEYIMTNDSAPMDAETKTYVEQQINKRAMAKLKKDYETADAIRNELMDEYQVSIDDRVREWFKQGGEDDGETTASTIMSEDDEEEKEAEEAPVVVAEAPADEAAEDLEKLTIPELKERLRAAELTVGGNKSELIERLTASS